MRVTALPRREGLLAAMTWGKRSPAFSRVWLSVHGSFPLVRVNRITTADDQLQHPAIHTAQSDGFRHRPAEPVQASAGLRSLECVKNASGMAYPAGGVAMQK